MLQSVVYMAAPTERLAEQQIAPKPFASIKPVTEIFMHGYVERSVIGPSLPDENTMFVANAAIALIRAGKAERLRIATKCNGNDPERQLSVAERTYHYLRAELGPGYENFPIFVEPVADTTIQEVRHFGQVLKQGASNTSETFMVLALDPHLKRIHTIMDKILGHESTGTLHFYGAGEVLGMSNDPAERAYATEQLESSAMRAFTRREQLVYRRLSALPGGIHLMDGLNKLQRDDKILARLVYQLSGGE